VANFTQDSIPKALHPLPGYPKGASSSSPNGGTLKEAIDGLERDLILDAMARFKGNKKRVASHLGISRSYLYKKLEE